jgi:Cu/Ag efflux pump CusA
VVIVGIFFSTALTLLVLPGMLSVAMKPAAESGRTGEADGEVDAHVA